MDEIENVTEFVVDCHYKPTVQIPNESFLFKNNAIIASVTEKFIFQINTFNSNKIADKVYRGFISRSRYRLYNPNPRYTSKSVIIAAKRLSDDSLVGIIEIYPTEPAYLCNLSVKPSERRQGIAKLLCLLAEYFVVQHWHINTITLQVDRSNTIARRLYESLSYLPMKQRTIMTVTQSFTISQNSELMSYKKELDEENYEVEWY